jgi:hypothetical protein
VGNTVGSLSGVQREIITGCLLGDGSMRCKTNALLEINHSIHQRSYVDWKFGHLAPLVRTPPKARNGNGNRVAYRFVTRSLPELTDFYELFYESGKKVVPELELTPMTLAVWTMDDGCRSRSAVYMNTQQFASQSQVRLMRMLWEQWGIASNLNRDKTYWRIRVTTVGSMRLREIVMPFMLPELMYKLPQVTP